MKRENSIAQELEVAARTALLEQQPGQKPGGVSPPFPLTWPPGASDKVRVYFFRVAVAPTGMVARDVWPPNAAVTLKTEPLAALSVDLFQEGSADPIRQSDLMGPDREDLAAAVAAMIEMLQKVRVDPTGSEPVRAAYELR